MKKIKEKIKNRINWYRLNKKEVIIALMISLLGFFIGLFTLTKENFWADETHSLLVAKLGLKFLLTEDCHTPFYFILLKLWHGGIGDFSYYLVYTSRYLSLCFFVATIFTTYFLVRTLYEKEKYSKALAVTVSILIAINPTLLRFATQTREYSLGVFLSILSIYVFYCTYKKQKYKFFWFYIIITFLMLETHYFTILILLPQLYLLIKENKSHIRYLTNLFHIFKNQIIIFLLYIPQLIVFYFQLKEKMMYPDWIELRSHYNIFYILYEFFFPVGNLSQLINAKIMSMIIMLVFLTILTISFIYIIRKTLKMKKNKETIYADKFIFLCSFLPIIIITFIDIFIKKIIVPRYFVFFLIPFWIFLIRNLYFRFDYVGIERHTKNKIFHCNRGIKTSIKRHVIVFILLFFLIFTYPYFYSFNTEIDTILNYLNSDEILKENFADVILHESSFSFLSISYATKVNYKNILMENRTIEEQLSESSKLFLETGGEFIYLGNTPLDAVRQFPKENMWYLKSEYNYVEGEEILKFEGLQYNLSLIKVKPYSPKY